MRVAIASSLCLLYWIALVPCAVENSQLAEYDQSAYVFKEGKSHYYSYVLKHTAAKYNGEERFLLEIKCDIRVDAFGFHKYYLNTNNCSMYNEHNVLHEQSNLFSKQMEKNPVLVRVSPKGSVYYDISANEDEDNDLLNIKRGIISTFQTVPVGKQKETPTITTKRNGIHGVCDVLYQRESETTIKSTKQWRNCTAHKKYLDNKTGLKVEYPLNEECSYHFNDANDFDIASCTETPSRGLTNFLTYSHRFRRSLSLVKSTSLVNLKKDDDTRYRMIDIKFQYVDHPKSNPPNLKKTVITSIERMVELSHSPIESESFWLFNGLVEILNSSINLDILSVGIDDCWGSPKCQSAKTPSAERNRIHFGHIWRDALVQCGSTACIKAFKSFVTESTVSMADVLSDEIMEDIYYEWLIKGNTDLEFIYSIFDICNYRNENLCYLAFSSNIHRYWKINSLLTTFPAKLNSIVENVIEPIKRCQNASAEDSRLLLSLKMLSNIGEYAEVVETELINLLYQCATKPTTDWLISVAAINAFRRMESSSKLYMHLLNIIKNPSLKQDIRVNAYLLLVDKWAEKAADDVHTILKSEAIDDTIKAFIYSHIKAVLKAQDHVRVRLAEAFRKIVDNDTLEFFSYDTHKKIVSKFVEESLFHISPMTPGIGNLNGYLSSGTHLYDGHSYLPSSLLSRWKLTANGEEFEFGEVSYYSKGFVNILTKAVETILKSENIDEGSSSMFKLFNARSKTTKANFLSGNLDKNIVHTLENIITKLSESLNVQPSLLLSANIFGEEAGYAGFVQFSSYVLNITRAQAGKSIYRGNAEIFKTSITIGTSGGLTLKYFLHSELMIVTDSKLAHHDSSQKELGVTGINNDISLSFAVSTQVGATVEIAGFYRKGFSDELFASASGALVADLSMDSSVSGRNVLRLELQSNSKQAVLFSKQCVAIDGNERQYAFPNKIPDPTCSNLGKGIKFCKIQQFEGGVYHRYELQMPEKHPAVLRLKINSKDNQTYFSTDISLAASSEGVHNLKQLLNYNSAFDKTKDVQRVVADSELFPHFKYEANVENANSDDNLMRLIKGSFTPEIDFHYYTKKSISEFEDVQLESKRVRLSKGSPPKDDVLGQHYIQNIFLSTSKGNFTVVFIKQRFPFSAYYDLFLQFEWADDAAANRLFGGIKLPASWADSRTVALNGHHGTESILDHFESGVPEYRTYTLVQLQNYTIEMDSQSSIVDEHSVLSTLNFTSPGIDEDIPVSELLCNLSLFRKNVIEKGVVVSKEIVATLSVPHLKWIFSLDDHRGPIDHPDVNFDRDPDGRRFVMKLQRRVNENDTSEYQRKPINRSFMSDEPPSTQEISFDFSASHLEYGLSGINFVTNLNYTGFPWLNTKADSENSPTGYIQFRTLPRGSYEDITYYSLYSNYLNRALYGTLNARFFYVYQQLDLLDHSNTTISRLVNTLTYGRQDYNLHRVDLNLSSDVCTFSSQWITDYNSNTTDFSLLAQSPYWSMLNVDLKQLIFRANKTETFRLKHDVIDIEVDSSWNRGHEITFVFNSKTVWIPTMRWKLSCESIHRCVAQLNFTKPESFTVYIVNELSPGSTEMTLTICRNRICKDIITDPNDFVFQAVFSLIEPFTVVRTVTFDLIFINQLGVIAVQNIFGLLVESYKVLSVSTHPIHKIFQHYVGISIDESTKLLAISFGRTSQLLLNDLSAVFLPVYPVAVYTGITIVDVIGQFVPTTVAKSIFHFNRYRLLELRAMYIYLIDGFKQRPGPFPGYSVVQDWQSPVALKPLYPIRFNPKLAQYWKESWEEKNVIHDAFFDKQYSRVALVIGYSTVRPFEGGLIKIHQPECPQLLAYDVDDQKFIIYKQDSWLHIIFSKSHLELSYDNGQFNVDSVHHEMPFEHSTREFSVIRKGDHVILNTSYHLKIICDLNDHYCVFYTDLWKFGRLYGLLGNNTDAVLAQQRKFYDRRYTSLFDLTNQSSCVESTDLRMDSDRPDNQWSCQPFTSWHPTYPTFVCFDTIDPQPYHTECIAKGPNADLYPYLAACGALDIPVNLGHHWHYECAGNHKIGSVWKKNIYQRNADVVFIVDQSLDSKYWRSYSKSLSNLAVHIKNKFAGNSYTEIKFGLFGLRGPGIMAHPTLYTIKNAFWGSAEDFSSSALSHLFSVKRSNESEQGNGDLFEAIRLVMDTAPFDDQAARFIVLVTPQDPFDVIEVEDLYELLDSLKPRRTTLHTISSYKELPKGAYGIVGNQLSKPENLKSPIPTPPSGFKDLLQGHLARLALANKGAVWSLSHLESGPGEDQNEFYSTVSAAMVNRAKQFIDKDFHCTCKAPNFFNSYEYC